MKKFFIPSSKQFIVLAVLVTMATNLVIGGLYFLFHQRYTTHNTIEKTQLAAKTLQDTMHNIGTLMNYASASIVGNSSDLNYVERLLAGFRNDLKIKDVASWSMLDWVNTNQELLITSTSGILKAPINLSKTRPLVASALQHPGKLFIGQAGKGVISGAYIIPASMGVADKNGKAVGALHIALSVSSIGEKIFHKIGADYQFALLDQNKNLTYSSIDLPENFFLQNDYMNKEVGKTRFSEIVKIADFPYSIALGYNKELDWDTLLYRSSILCLTSTLLLFMVFFALYFLARTIYTLVTDKKKAELAQKEAEAEGQAALKSINAIASTYKLNMDAFSMDDTAISPLLVEETVQSCLNVCAHSAFIKNVALNLTIDAAPYFTTNALQLKQIIIGFTSYALVSNFEDGAITVNVQNKEAYGKRHLVIAIKDKGIIRETGFGCGEINIDMALDAYADKPDNCMGAPLLDALKCIKNLQGDLFIRTVAGSGNYGTDYVISIPEQEEANNVIDFKQHVLRKKN